MEKETKSVYDYESLCDRIKAIGLLFDSVVTPIQADGGIADKGVFWETMDILSQLTQKAGDDAMELYKLSTKSARILQGIGDFKL